MERPAHVQLEGHLGGVASMAEAVFVDRGEERGTAAFSEGALAAALAPAAREQRLRCLHPLLHAMRQSPCRTNVACASADSRLRCLHPAPPAARHEAKPLPHQCCMRVS
jgi:hypothetical protein